MMLAYRLVQPQQPPELQEVRKPSPGSGQLLIKVGGCGLCHTDLGLMRRTKADWGNTPPPFTLGYIKVPNARAALVDAIWVRRDDSGAVMARFAVIYLVALTAQGWRITSAVNPSE